MIVKVQCDVDAVVKLAEIAQVMSQTKGIKVGAPLCVLHSELDLAQRQPCSAFKMRYIAAYMLAVMGGNVDPSAEDVSAILSSVGVDVDLERLNLVIGKMKGQNLEDLMSKGGFQLDEFFFRITKVESQYM